VSCASRAWRAAICVGDARSAARKASPPSMASPLRMAAMPRRYSASACSLALLAAVGCLDIWAGALRGGSAMRVAAGPGNIVLGCAGVNAMGAGVCASGLAVGGLLIAVSSFSAGVSGIGDGVSTGGTSAASSALGSGAAVVTAAAGGAGAVSGCGMGVEDGGCSKNHTAPPPSKAAPSMSKTGLIRRCAEEAGRARTFWARPLRSLLAALRESRSRSMSLIRLIGDSEGELPPPAGRSCSLGIGGCSAHHGSSDQVTAFAISSEQGLVGKNIDQAWRTA
jgi:hypothetical protein